MKKQSIFVLALVLGISGFAFAQSKTITNADLAKFTQQRLQAEKDLRENYRELGFPSPEELERQNDESSRMRAELAQRLREERLEKEKLNLERERLYLEREYRQVNNSQDNYSVPANSYPNSGFIDYSRYRTTTTYGYPDFGAGILGRILGGDNYYRGRRHGINNINQNGGGNVYLLPGVGFVRGN
jgi:hypothetical protein